MKTEKFEIQEFCAWLVEQVSDRTAQKVAERMGQGGAGEAPAGEEALSVGEAAAFLKLGQSTIYKLSSSGRLASVKLGGRLVFRRMDLIEYLEAHRRGDGIVSEHAKAARKGE